MITLNVGREGGLSLWIPHEDIDSFKTMVARACNTWQDSPKEIKELRDLIIPPGYVPASLYVNRKLNDLP